MITKIVSASNNTNSHNVDYQSSGKKAMTAPKILEEYIDDDGNKNYVLAGNKTQLADAYNQLWNPTKTPVQWNNRGINPDGRRRGLE